MAQEMAFGEKARQVLLRKIAGPSDARRARKAPAAGPLGATI